jgi:hypothetical protein
MTVVEKLIEYFGFIIVYSAEGKRPLGRPRRRWEDYITADIQEVGCGYVGWIELSQDSDSLRAIMNAIMNLRV